MAGLTWERTVLAGLTWPTQHALIVSVPRGGVLRVVHLGWGFYGNTSSDTALSDTAGNIMVMGIVTTVGNGTEIPPNPRTQELNQAPPTQRWLYWEGRAPAIAAYDAFGQLALWRDSGAQAPSVTRGEVSAKTIPVGDTLQLWASWSAANTWDGSGVVNLWLYASAGYST